jgi:hypothetical protein
MYGGGGYRVRFGAPAFGVGVKVQRTRRCVKQALRPSAAEDGK